jgi:large subunit ribosomal protein L32
MPVPKNRRSKSRRDKRHANKGLKVKTPTKCQTCNAAIASHQACSECGYYKGVKVLRTKTDRMHDRGQARKAKEAQAKSQAPGVTAEAEQGTAEKKKD